ncbi:hypothetical protein JHL18_17100 [Clostridium sp. YIM B02505]|uniref:Uncharacterized protein n=1 Tax=Clostridium yunnanense TaxID=2800325 RepID=A0ABS1ESJ1_9CLOT|nr:hypothetical protein [Clostridium yunnanense]MBK1812344.1 hypothetical protein [Clostridium yunnanense]
MKFIAIIIILILNMYLLSFAKYQWKNNKLSAIGSLLIAIISFVLPTYIILIR